MLALQVCTPATLQRHSLILAVYGKPHLRVDDGLVGPRGEFGQLPIALVDDVDLADGSDAGYVVHLQDQTALHLDANDRLEVVSP